MNNPFKLPCWIAHEWKVFKSRRYRQCNNCGKVQLWNGLKLRWENFKK